VRDAAGAAALCFIVERSGRPRVLHDRGGSWTVSDRLDRRRVVDVLVCGASAVDASEALAAFSAGQARAIVCLAQPEQLVAALAALEVGLSLVPADLLERARQCPDVTERQRRVLGAVMAGQSNTEIARALQVKPVTIKREVAALFVAFDACRRFELISQGFDLGYRREPARP
jgi:DNA-binding NarL/FixJ family response regulator